MTVEPTVAAQSGWRIRPNVVSGDDALEYRPAHAARPQTGAQKKAVRDAVLGHIKALRKLGYTRVNTRDIAGALGLPQKIVEQAASQLREEGVKIAK